MYGSGGKKVVNNQLRRSAAKNEINDQYKKENVGILPWLSRAAAVREICFCSYMRQMLIFFCNICFCVSMTWGSLSPPS